MHRRMLVYERDGVSLTYTIRAIHDGTSIKRIDGASRVVKHDNNYHSNVIAVTSDH